MTQGRRGNPDTAERLVGAAIRLFATKWYGTVSVAEICREAGLSNGIFYRYFEGKEALFKLILGRVLEQIRGALEAIGGATPQARIRAMAEAMYQFSLEHGDLVAVFREGQYRHFDYEQRLSALYQGVLATALGREVDLADTLFAFGNLRFGAIRWATGASPLGLDAACQILMGGLLRGQTFDAARVFGGSATPLPVPLDEGVRDRLLRSGRRLFGEKGYFETNIHEITDGAGLSVGAFYTHFDGKEAFYAELIARVGHEVRAFIASNLSPAGAEPVNALEMELRGLWLWLVYLSMDKHCYNIVREAEFVLPDAVKAYYGAFATGYRARPKALRVTAARPELDETTAIDALMGIAHYLGLEAAFDTAPLNARALVEGLGHRLAHGLLPSNPSQETL